MLEEEDQDLNEIKQSFLTTIVPTIPNERGIEHGLTEIATEAIMKK